ncbi:MAG: 3D domain-containing protein [Thermaerobacter sp.]|nr:3D domain-containing protein [Thermaerobacter sp.]
MNLTATAYAPTAQDNYPYGAVDYYGRPLVAGDVAVDPSVIPLGTKLWVTGYSSPNLPPGGFLATADDTGGAIKGNRIDIFINASESQVSNFGIQQVKVYVLK